MDYPTLKLLHLMAAATWIGGMVGNGLAVALLAGSTSANGRALLASLRRWNRWVTSPALLAALAAGATLAVQAGWWGMPWLHIKLALVLALVGLHVWLSRALRRMSTVDPSWIPPGVLRLAAPVTFCTALAIALLALTKPV